jgi:hypothetical protein
MDVRLFRATKVRNAASVCVPRLERMVSCRNCSTRLYCALDHPAKASQRLARLDALAGDSVTDAVTVQAAQEASDIVGLVGARLGTLRIETACVR